MKVCMGSNVAKGTKKLLPMPSVDGAEEAGERPRRWRECYEFNPSMPKPEDDGWCHKCRKYLTVHCKYLDEFMDDVDDLEVD